jgi:hypothetical protein
MSSWETGRVVQKHNDHQGYVLLPDPRRIDSPDPVLGHLYRTREAGPVVTGRPHMDYSWPVSDSRLALIRPAIDADVISWPDFCDGSFTQYCDLSRQYDPKPSPNVTDGHAVPPYTGPGVDTFIEAFGRYDLLHFMNKYWINQGDTNAHFWAHEFSKHATCFSTYDTKCYKSYVQHEEVIDFFEVCLDLSPEHHSLTSKYLTVCYSRLGNVSDRRFPSFT